MAELISIVYKLQSNMALCYCLYHLVYITVVVPCFQLISNIIRFHANYFNSPPNFLENYCDYYDYLAICLFTPVYSLGRRMVVSHAKMPYERCYQYTAVKRPVFLIIYSNGMTIHYLFLWMCYTSWRHCKHCYCIVLIWTAFQRVTELLIILTILQFVEAL